MQKFCTKCGKELLLGSNFCVNCGNRNDIVPESVATRSGSAERHNTVSAVPKSLSFIVVIFVAVICLSAITIMKSNLINNTSFQNPPDAAAVKEDFTNPTNPAYLASPDEFIIDKENEISSAPPHIATKPDSVTKNNTKTPVWVEDILDENTIKVSYTVTQNGEKFLTFAAIHLNGLADINDNCKKNESVSFLKSFLKGKDIYLSSYDYNGYEEEVDCRESSEKFNAFAKRYPITTKKIFIMDVEVVDTFSLKIQRLPGASTSKNDSKVKLADGRILYIVDKYLGGINVNESLIASGYGYQKVWLPFCTNKSDKIHYATTWLINGDRETEAAKVAERGLWGNVCN